MWENYRRIEYVVEIKRCGLPEVEKLNKKQKMQAWVELATMHSLRMVGSLPAELANGCASRQRSILR